MNKLIYSVSLKFNNVWILKLQSLFSFKVGKGKVNKVCVRP